MRAVNQILGPAPAANSASTGKTQKTKSPHAILRGLLGIEYKNLNPENEMKKIFGSRVVQAENRTKRGHGGGRSRAPLRSSHSIIVPKAQWPNPGKTGGLSMRFVDSDKDGYQYFTFEHSQQYQTVQNQFFEAVETMNPDFIVVSHGLIF